MRLNNLEYLLKIIEKEKNDEGLYGSIISSSSIENMKNTILSIQSEISTKVATISWELILNNLVLNYLYYDFGENKNFNGVNDHIESFEKLFLLLKDLIDSQEILKKINEYLVILTWNCKIYFKLRYWNENCLFGLEAQKIIC